MVRRMRKDWGRISEDSTLCMFVVHFFLVFKRHGYAIHNSLEPGGKPLRLSVVQSALQFRIVQDAGYLDTEKFGLEIIDHNNDRYGGISKGIATLYFQAAVHAV